MNKKPEIFRWLASLIMIFAMHAVSPAIGFGQLDESSLKHRAEKSQVKILLIAGNPVWEYRYLQRELQRDPDCVLSCWLQTMDEDRPQEGNEPLDALPQTNDEMNQFDAIIMLDPDPADFSKEWMTSLQESCRQGTGLLYVAGPSHSEMFLSLNKCAPIREVLPVKFSEEFEAEAGNAEAKSDSRKIRIVTDNQGHPVLKLVAEEAENREIWNSMPAIRWVYPILDKQADAVTLLQVADGTPLAIAGRYESGNVLFIGSSGTWRWRRSGTGTEHFQQFWKNVTDFLVQADD